MHAEPTAEELHRWHRFFAVECNNSAWQMTLDDASERNTKAMLNAAHASVYHWLHVGTELNKMRGYTLLAHVHAFCGHGAIALEYINEAYAYFRQNKTESWEYAFTHMIRAQAAHVAGNHKLHAEAYAEAKSIIDGMEEGGDKEVVMMTWGNIPAP